MLCRFSGGYPASNGDISGVAKNSYLIENGEIRGPVSEVMVSANIPNMLNNIVSCSRESINFGSSIAPWMRVSDVTIS
ncbi:metallopeptidase TldD-related protein, partial [Shewanella algae]|uniref:metallopeptidase TldD-related protein n=1 Tax=Shewanella algae TaxID=38313 RepID=UPI003CC7A919